MTSMERRVDDGLIVLRWWFDFADPQIRGRLVDPDSALSAAATGSAARGVDDIVEMVRDRLVALERDAGRPPRA